MNISVIGSGYVGLVTGACLAELGNKVICLDIDEAKIEILNSGKVPFFEPGLENLIARNCSEGRLIFTTDFIRSTEFGDLQFIAVGTPSDKDSRADLQFVLAASENIAKSMNSFKIIVNKSTVPIGTGDKVSAVVSKVLNDRGITVPFTVVSNPEFLKEGAAINDFMSPDRIVVGTHEDSYGIKAREILRNLYAPLNRSYERIYFMDIRSAELTKYAANSMLATRISFMNELANLAEKVGADIEKVRVGIGSDSRIGRDFLYAGTGYGGSCFPKDVSALIKTASDHGYQLKILEAVHFVNSRQKTILIDKIITKYGSNLKGMNIGLWGLAFKPNTDDMREAPSLVVIKKLLEMGAVIKVHDPKAIEEARHSLKRELVNDNYFEKVTFCSEPEDVLVDSDFLVILTEWKVYLSPDFVFIKKSLKFPVIFDGRNIYDPKLMRQLGFDYFSVGRNI